MFITRTPSRMALVALIFFLSNMRTRVWMTTAVFFIQFKTVPVRFSLLKWWFTGRYLFKWDYSTHACPSRYCMTYVRTTRNLQSNSFVSLFFILCAIIFLNKLFGNLLLKLFLYTLHEEKHHTNNKTSNRAIVFLKELIFFVFPQVFIKIKIFNLI